MGIFLAALLFFYILILIIHELARMSILMPKYSPGWERFVVTAMESKSGNITEIPCFL